MTSLRGIPDLAGAPPAAERRPVAVGLVDWLAAALERRRQRLALMQLDDRMLKDVGLTRSDLQHETEKPFWRR